MLGGDQRQTYGAGLKFLGSVVLALCFGIAGAWYYFSPEYSRVGYAPLQPIAFSHKVHTGELGIDCRYCHYAVEKSWYANIPDTASCMNCHNQVLSDDPRIVALRESIESGTPVNWVRVHRLPDYVFFNHAVHVNRGVGCAECHGQVNQMDTMTHAKSLSMTMCLQCHRYPERFLRPPEEVFNLDWKPPNAKVQRELGQKLARELNIRTSRYCSSCHR